jgi:hypothetical protein
MFDAIPHPGSRMADTKTHATAVSVASHLAAIPNDARRADCEALAALMSTVTKQPAVMWGPSIVGFGRYHYVYDSGHSGDMCVVGFASRANEIAIYLGSSFPERDALLAQLGKHKLAKACLYVKRLADVNQDVLATMIAASYADTVTRWP